MRDHAAIPALARAGGITRTRRQALADTGRERDAVALALTALARHLPRYTRSLAAYADDLRGG